MRNRRQKESNPIISTTGEKIRYSVGEFAGNLINGVLGGYMTMYLTDNVLMSTAVLGIITLLSKLFDGVSDIIMGVIIEKTHTRWGKARPWILWMGIPLILTFLGQFHVPAGLNSIGKIAYVAILITVHSAVTFTAVNMAIITLFTLFAPDGADRNKATTWRTLFSMVASLGVNIITMPLLQAFGGVKAQSAWDKIGIIYSIIIVICLLICFFGTKEKDITSIELENLGITTANKKQKKSIKEIFKVLCKSKYFYLAALMCVAYYMGNSTSAINVYYARDILGDANLVGVIGVVSLPTMIIAAIIAPILYNKFGKKKTMMAGSIVTIVATLGQLINPYSMGLFLGLYAIKGIGIMLFGCGIGTMPGDVADWSEWKSGERAEGIVSSLASFGIKVGSGVGASLVAWFLAIGHYDGTLEIQAQSALNSEIAMMIGVPMALAVIQIILLLFWDMDKIHPQILKELGRGQDN